jgi:hypothetical protein
MKRLLLTGLIGLMLMGQAQAADKPITGIAQFIGESTVKVCENTAINVGYSFVNCGMLGLVAGTVGILKSSVCKQNNAFDTAKKFAYYGAYGAFIPCLLNIGSQMYYLMRDAKYNILTNSFKIEYISKAVGSTLGIVAIIGTLK